MKKMLKFTAWLTINRACNLRCSWCYAKMTNYNNNHMNLGIVKRSIDLFKSLSLKSVILIGGEPLIHPNFIDIVKMITKSGLKVYVVTNAMLFSNKKFLSKALDAGVSSITVSFKASNKEDFKSFTGRDGFSKTLQAINNIAKEKIPYVINVTACETLLENFDEMIDVVVKTGARVFSVDTGKPIIIEGKTYADGMGTPKQLSQFFMKIYQKLERSGLRFSIKVAIPFCLFPKEFIDKIIKDGNILTGCQMVTGRGIILDPQGNLIPCNHVCDQSLGKIGNDFFNVSDYLKFRQKTEVSEFYKLVSTCPHKNCVSCSYWSMCGAGCKLYWLHYGADDLIGNFN
ncbi:MAG: radical SAM protein [Nanoarchaeota archaeon]